MSILQRVCVGLLGAASILAVLGGGPVAAEPGPFTDQFVKVPVAVAGSYRPTVGNFDGEGRDEILWWGVGTVSDSLWRIDSVSPFERSSFKQTVGFWRSTQALVGDYDGDGRDDIFWYTPGPSADAVWYGGPGLIWDKRAVNVNGSYFAAVGEFVGPDRSDIVWVDRGPAASSRLRWWSGSSSRGTFGTHAPQDVDWNFAHLEVDGIPSDVAGVVSTDVPGTEDGLLVAVSSSCCIGGELVPLKDAVPGGQPHDAPTSVGPWDMTGFGRHFVRVGSSVVVAQPGTPSLAITPEGHTPFDAPPHFVTAGSRSGGVIVWHVPGAALDELWFAAGLPTP